MASSIRYFSQDTGACTAVRAALTVLNRRVSSLRYRVLTWVLAGWATTAQWGLGRGTLAGSLQERGETRVLSEVAPQWSLSLQCWYSFLSAVPGRARRIQLDFRL